MPLENRNLEPGTVLVARYKKQDRTCEVVQTEEGLRYRLDDGSEHKSPSSAGKAAMGGVACNGWRFWSLQGTEKPKREPKAKVEKLAKPAPKKAPAKAAPKGKGEEGQVREEAEGGAHGREGRFVRLRRLRRVLPDAEEGGRARADAHVQLTALLATATGSTRSLLSLYALRPLPTVAPVPTRPDTGGTRIPISVIDAILMAAGEP